MAAEGLDGVLPVDKPRGPTSHDVVAVARRALHTRRIGHTGTLDPFASGLLLLCVGPATRIAEYITGMDKRYRAVVHLGVRRDTDDDTGAVLAEQDPSHIGPDAVDGALRRFHGTILQVPPQYSAKKLHGERAYRIAREGGVADLAPVQVTVHSVTVVRFDSPEIELDVRCSSGTYVRSLARDLGDVLGVGAHLSALRRTAIGDCDVADAVTLDALTADADAAVSRIIAPLDALRGMPRCDVDDPAVEHIRHGRSVECDSTLHGLTAVAAHGRLVALADAVDGRLRPKKVFVA